jgi:RNA methyltransferase, TrmH family
MITKNKSRFIISLQKKKMREEEGLYVIEGDKLVREYLSSGVPVRTLVAKKEFIMSLSRSMKESVDELVEASFDELKVVSTLKTPHNALALVQIPDQKMVPEEVLEKLCIALDFVQDPGNFGTIIRAAAWFGIRNIICSDDCVDLYNSKVIQASMGAILHVNVYYTELKRIASLAIEKGIPVFGTFPAGDTIYGQKLGNKGIILMGNESRGVSDELLPFVTHKIMIPGAGRSLPGIESLNVGIAAAVVLYEFQRQNAT